MASHAVNRSAWDRLAAGSAFARVATDEELAQPLLTLDARGWLPGRVEGLEVLCLAAGGGWQSMLYAAAGARVTVVDLSSEMLALDARESRRRNLPVTIVEASMDALPLEPQSFDIVHQPVSTCYLSRLGDVYAEVARVLRPDGLYISQHKNPTSLQVTHTDVDSVTLGIPYHHAERLPTIARLSQTDPTGGAVNREAGCTEYLHRWHSLIGGLCTAGFVIEDLTEPHWARRDAAPGTMAHRAQFVPPFVRIKARRLAAREASVLWTP